MDKRINAAFYLCAAIAWASAFLGGLNIATMYPNPAYDATLTKFAITVAIWTIAIHGLRRNSP